jgi:pimeloyl-ACP methyl ester carboxylesterase
MRPSDSVFVDIRGLRYHCRTWGDPAHPKLFLLHGWMDVSASFQFLVDALRGDWHAVAPDWRGYGLTQWTGADSYWFPDYIADLDALLARFSPEQAVNLVGHSMGGNVACLYAGVRPERVAKLVNLEGFGLRGNASEQAPARYAEWLAELGAPQCFRDYASFDDLAARLRQSNPRLTPERAAFLAHHWGMPTPDGRVGLRSDPAHKRVNPVLYRLEEAATGARSRRRCSGSRARSPRRSSACASTSPLTRRASTASPGSAPTRLRTQVTWCITISRRRSPGSWRTSCCADPEVRGARGGC